MRVAASEAARTVLHTPTPLKPSPRMHTASTQKMLVETRAKFAFQSQRGVWDARFSDRRLTAPSSNLYEKVNSSEKSQSKDPRCSG